MTRKRAKVSDEDIIEGDGTHRKAAPGKKKLDMELGDGARLSALPVTFGKKDTVEFEVISAEERWRHLPELADNEAAVSEVYIIRWTGTAQQPLALTIPLANVDWSVRTARVRLRELEDSAEWTDSSQLELEGRKARLEVDRPCQLVVLARPRQELFIAPVAGVLYTAKINRFVSLRFPKKVVDADLEVGLKLDGIDSERLVSVQQMYPQRCGDVLLHAEHFIDVRTDRPASFRRAVTVKLPLPRHDEGEFDPNNPQGMVGVLQQDRSSGEWKLLEQPLKLTRQVAAFDVKSLGRYCVAMAPPGKARKLPEAISLLEQQSQRVEGEVMTFIKYEAKLWHMAIEVCALKNFEKIEEEWGKRGYQYLPREEPKTGAITETKSDFRPNFRNRRVISTQQENDIKAPTNKILLPQHCRYYYELSGNIRILTDENTALSSDSTDNSCCVHYHENLTPNSVEFEISPRSATESRDVSVCFFDTNSPITRHKLQVNRWQLPTEVLDEYYRVEQVTPPPEEEETPTEEASPVVEEKETTAVVTGRFNYTPRDERSYQRLITLKRPPIYIDKEPRVLSGRSLRSLAAAVPQGLTLAVHLQLSDSSITGIGFDALANGSSLNDVTYKILMYWKRMHTGTTTEKISDMVQAYRDMGQLDLADLIEDREEENKDIDLQDACLAAHLN